MKFFFVSLFAFFSTCLPAFSQIQITTFESAFKTLSGKGDKSSTSSLGYKYEIFEVEKNESLQLLIDDIHVRLLTTRIGQEICRLILKSNPVLIAHHFAMSQSRAELAAQFCSQSTEDSGIIDAPEIESGVLITQPRRFRIVVTDDPKVTADSWTDSFQNQTVIYLQKTKTHSDLNLRYLVQVISHEDAIYFDAKSWPGGPVWSQSPSLSALKILNLNSDRVFLAALHPTIANVLSFVRAYKIERQMVRELIGTGSLGVEPLFYPVADYPFLRLSCRRDCLRDFILDHRKWLDPLALSLLAFSPQFRTRRLQLIQNENPYGFDSQSASYLLGELPVTYLFSASTQSQLFAPTTIENYGLIAIEDQARASKYLNGQLLGEDLQLLYDSNISWPNGTEIDFLTFLSTPLLSQPQLNYSSGPRPRIRTGGTQ